MYERPELVCYFCKKESRVLYRKFIKSLGKVVDACKVCKEKQIQQNKWK